MPAFYLTKPGTTLRYENSSFCVEAPGQAPVTVPEFRVDAVVSFGAAHITHAAMSRLFKKATPVFFLTRFGRPMGMLVPAYDTRSDVRLAQFRAVEQAEHRMTFATTIMLAKVRHARCYLQRYRRNHPESGLETYIDDLAQDIRHIETASSIPSLRGLEGAAARRYFEAIRKILPPELFDGRSRRPPADPANALFSLGYTLLGWEICGQLIAAGVDPYLGMYHVTRRGLPALAQDLLEIFRTPVVERFAIARLHLREITAEDFIPGPKGGLRLGDQPLRLLLQKYEEALSEPFTAPGEDTPSNFRRILTEEVTKLRRSFTAKVKYEPLRWDHVS